MATKYNGAIQVRPCTVINIPQPGVIQELVFDAGSSYDNTGPQPIITGLPAATTQLLVENNIGGGDVIYATNTTTLVTGTVWSRSCKTRCEHKTNKCLSW